MILNTFIWLFISYIIIYVLWRRNTLQCRRSWACSRPSSAPPNQWTGRLHTPGIRLDERHVNHSLSENFSASKLPYYPSYIVCKNNHRPYFTSVCAKWINVNANVKYLLCAKNKHNDRERERDTSFGTSPSVVLMSINVGSYPSQCE